MKRSIAIGISILMGFTLVFPGASFAATSNKSAKKSAEKQAAKEAPFSMKSVKQLTGAIASVNTTGNFVMVGKGKSQKKILTSKAVMVQITKDGARSVSLTDLVLKTKTHFWVKKKKTAAGEFEALAITQFLNALPQPAITVSFPSTASSGQEQMPATLQLNLSAAASKDVKIDYLVSGTATGSSTDYTLLSGSATIATGQTAVSLALNIVDDNLTEENETIIVTLVAATNAALGEPKVHTYTIEDNDQPVVSFPATSSSGSEALGTANLQVSLTKVSAQEVKVDYAVTGTATGGGTDYTLANGTAVIPAGQTSTTIALTVVNDTGMESDETVIVTLSNPRGATLGLNAVYTYTIQDNDQPTFSFSAGTSTGLESATSVNIPVSLSAVSSRETTVAYVVSGGSATGSGTDFTLANGTLTIPAGQTTGNISLAVADDAVDELDETVIVTLSSPVNAALGSATSHTYTIQDNDVVVAQFSSASSSGSESAASVNIPVSLSQAPAASVQVSYTVSGTATGGGTDYTLANGAVTVNAGQTTANISLAVVDDAVVDANETVIVTLSSPVNATLGNTAVYTYTINDND